jgi:L-threonylcarbamoyladenylate synthase
MQFYDENQASQAAQAFLDHKILAFPTDTVYGVGVIFGDLTDLQRLKNAKRRPEEKPIPMMAGSLEQFEEIAVLNDTAKKLAKALLPGALTLIVNLKEGIDPAFCNGNKTVAIRVPDKPFVLEMISQIGRPLFVSSANVSGEPTALTWQDALAQLPGIDGIVKGECPNLQASTIVDCTKESVVILREGPISKERIDEILATK